MTDLADDVLNEWLLQLCYRKMLAARDSTAQSHWCERMTHYVKLRSPERIHAMERERGL